MAIPNDPITREEQYLASMAGQEADLPQPITRVEKYLAKASGMDVETPDPLTRVERYLDVIAESGGSSVTVEPLVVTANGTTTAPSGKAYSPVTVDVPNPNYVETISGTLDNPWGNADRAWLKSAVSGNEASAMMFVDGTAVGMQSITVLMSPTGSPSVLWFSASNYYEQFQTICFGWGTDSGALTVAVALINGTTVDLSTYATAVHTTLTIIHHPMPDSE